MRGDGRIKLRGSVYHCAYYVNGREYRESCKTSDEKKALKYLRHRLKEKGADELGAQKFTPPQMKKLSVDDLLKSLKADFELRGIMSAQNRSGLKTAREAFGHIKTVAFSPEHVDAYIKRQLVDDYRPATINRVTGYVEQAFALAVKEGKFLRAPYIKRLSEKDNVRQGFCSKEEFLRVHANLPDDLKDFCMFAFATGWRRGEIARLDWSNVQDNDSMIRLRPDQTKNGFGRSVPVEDELKGIIERRRAKRRIDLNGTAELSHLVFHRGDGKRIGDFRKAWAKASKAAGLPNLLFHDLRRAAVTALINAGVPQLVAMSVSGHRTSSMFFRYGIKVEDEQRAAMQALAAYHQRKLQEAEQRQKMVSIAL